MLRPSLRLLASLALLGIVHAANAQGLFKCTLDGKITYTGKPCKAGTSEQIEVPPPPTPRPDAKSERDREDALSASLRKERLAKEGKELKEERVEARQEATAENKQKKCDKERLQKKWADEDAANANGRTVNKAKQKARRDAELLKLECPA